MIFCIACMAWWKTERGTAIIRCMKREEQLSFATAGFDRFAHTTRRATFLAEMDRIVPWDRLCAIVEPHYPTGEGGRPAIALDRMLRICFLQQWFNLGDPTVEEALYDSRAMEAFAKIDLGREPVPDETTICKFRHLLEQCGLGPALLAEVNAHLAENGLKIGRGTIVDATIIAAPSSTKNASGKRGCGVMRPIAARPMSSDRERRMRLTSHIRTPLAGRS